jgi:cysteine protease ATG4
MDPITRLEEASEEVVTEGDPFHPITPGPNSRFPIRAPPEGKMKQMDKIVNEKGGFVLEDGEERPFEGGDIKDDWVDPSIRPLPLRSSSIPVNDLPPPAVVHAAVSTPIKRNGSAKKGKTGKKGGEVPDTQERLPFPPQEPSQDNSGDAPFSSP